MEESTDEVLEQAIFYVENGCYPPGLTKDRKRAVRKRAEQLEYVRETGEVFMRKNEKLLEIVRSVEDRKQKISVCHSGPTSHLGVTKTQKAVADRFYWKGMADDVRDYVSPYDQFCVLRTDNPERAGTSLVSYQTNYTCSLVPRPSIHVVSYPDKYTCSLVPRPSIHVVLYPDKYTCSLVPRQVYM